MPAPPVSLIEVPDNGWLADLTIEQQQTLVGAMLHVFSGARAATGLVTDITDGVLRLFREDRAEPIEHSTIATGYTRLPGHRTRPALARALVYQREWDRLRDSLTDDNGKPLNRDDYDTACGNYEAGVVNVYESLLLEYSSDLYPVAHKEAS
ncbi:hypothetical protein [Streptomyces sp. NPDC017260]|uniref:hypothetical protein n=1 Tax=unclassified Streptomyces TaxID=2593676 RepID=UPI00379B6DF4